MVAETLTGIFLGFVIKISDRHSYQLYIRRTPGPRHYETHILLILGFMSVGVLVIILEHIIISLSFHLIIFNL